MKQKERDPYSWDNISINTYYEIMDILDDKDMDEMTRNVCLVALLEDRDEQEIWDMPIPEVSQHTRRLSFMNKFDLPKTPMTLKLGDYDLRMVKDLNKITTAQYYDYIAFVRQPLRDSIDKILSICLIPDGCSYNTGYDITDLQQTIRDKMPFNLAQSYLSFFLRRSVTSLISSLTCLAKKMRKMKDQEKKKEMEEMMKRIQENLLHIIPSTGL